MLNFSPMDDKPLASRLEGKTVGRWTVMKRKLKLPGDASGHFSSCYEVVDREGNMAFLKAFNYLYAFHEMTGSADTLKLMTENFTYERDLLLLCSNQKMRRVVTAIDSGEYREPSEIVPVPYLVFEIADGDLKSFLSTADLPWRLQAFHGALVGVDQLHRIKIVHQDIKPSNILIFGKRVSKISDLGSATQFGNRSNWEVPQHPGDMRYAPVELLYRHFSPHWETRRFGADLFMLGGLLTYLIADTNFLSLMYSQLQPHQRHDVFGGTFEQALPFLMNAYHLTLPQIKPLIPDFICNELSAIIAELSHPDPDKRGNPRSLPGTHNRFSLERYVSVIDRLSKRTR
jgi:serine/threonine protein kinase